jgi:hypothetical protein
MPAAQGLPAAHSTIGTGRDPSLLDFEELVCRPVTLSYRLLLHFIYFTIRMGFLKRLKKVGR